MSRIKDLRARVAQVPSKIARRPDADGGPGPAAVGRSGSNRSDNDGAGRSGSGRRRPGLPAGARRPGKPDPALAAAAGRALGEVREVFGDVPRGADAEQLVRRARRLVRQAALDEFAREGVTLLHLPEEWGRAELRKADVPGDAAFQEFVGEVISAIDISPSLLDREDAIELRRARSSRDAYGLSLEVAADLASYVLSRAWRISRAEASAQQGQGAAQEAQHGAASSAPADGATGHPATAPDDSIVPSEEEYVEQQAARIREDVRSALVRTVRVPLELRVAMDKHHRIEERAEGADPDAAFDDQEAEDLAEEVRDAAGGAGGGARSAGARSGGGAWTFGGHRAGGPGAGGRSADGDPSKPKRSLPEQVSAVHDFATSEAGRKTFDVMRTVGVKAFELYQQREEGKEGGKGGGPSAGGTQRAPKRPPSAG